MAVWAWQLLLRAYNAALFRRTLEGKISAIHVTEDTGVTAISSSLANMNIVLAVTGGIAATESIKLARELRRHGANITPIMTKSAEKVISPLALSWGSGTEVITDWSPEMAQLNKYHGILVAPATRNTIAKFIHGILDSPVMMALSSSNGNGTPLMFVPSMHDDIFDDPVTRDLIKKLEEWKSGVYFEDSVEGRRKQPNATSIVANFSNFVNSRLPSRKRVAVTLGSNRTQIDSIRFLENTSTGNTGWSISEHLFKMGHDVVCIAGNTTREPRFPLPEVIIEQTPQGMLESCIRIAESSDPPDCWIHSAAVLDYVADFSEGKKPSGTDDWHIKLNPSKKHIEEISKYLNGAIRIGFKLEYDEDPKNIVESALNQITSQKMNLVVANSISESRGDGPIRCRLVFPDGTFDEIPSLTNLCESLEQFIQQQGVSANE